MALPLVCIHCKNLDEEKLKDLRVMNKKNLKFEALMEIFAEGATCIADVIDLETFVEPASPQPNA